MNWEQLQYYAEVIGVFPDREGQGGHAILSIDDAGRNYFCHE